MKLIDEMKISLFKPQLYHKLKDMKFSILARFIFIVTIAEVIVTDMYTIFAGIVMGKLSQAVTEILPGDLVVFSGTIFWKWIIYMVAACIFAGIFWVISKFAKYKNMNFYKLYSYGAHILLLTILLKLFFGPFVMLLAIGYFFMAVKGEETGAVTGKQIAKYYKK